MIRNLMWGKTLGEKREFALLLLKELMYTSDQIARMSGLSVNTVYKIAKDNDINIRERQRYATLKHRRDVLQRELQSIDTQLQTYTQTLKKEQ